LAAAQGSSHSRRDQKAFSTACQSLPHRRQLLKANLDCAVNTSPMVQNEERAAMMGLL
jgi:hypothetical protein